MIHFKVGEKKFDLQLIEKRAKKKWRKFPKLKSFGNFFCGFAAKYLKNLK
jgi:hypothetical protein